MKKEIIVNWSPVENAGQGNVEIAAAQVAFTEPQPLLKEVGKVYGHTQFWKCPAVTAMCTNTFVVHAPMDITVELFAGADGAYNFRTPDITQDVVDAFFRIEVDGTLQMPPYFVMYCKEPLMVEVLPLLFLPSAVENGTLISGTFDIGKWIRPLTFAVLPKSYEKPIVIKRGDPLYCIRFLPKNGETVRFERVPMTHELKDVMSACTTVKSLIPRLPLKTLYELAKPLLAMFFKRSK